MPSAALQKMASSLQSLNSPVPTSTAGLVPGFEWHSASPGRQCDSLDSASPRLQPAQAKLLGVHTVGGADRSLRVRRSEDSGKPTSCR